MDTRTAEPPTDAMNLEERDRQRAPKGCEVFGRDNLTSRAIGCNTTMSVRFRGQGVTTSTQRKYWKTTVEGMRDWPRQATEPRQSLSRCDPLLDDFPVHALHDYLVTR